MKKLLLVVFLLLPIFAIAQDEERFPWILTIFGGGATFCTEDGCFGPSGYAVGASFGRGMSDRWSFELEGTYAYSTETGPARVDLATGIIFSPELERTRIYGGGHFLGKLMNFGASSDFFISIGAVGGYEQVAENVPEGFFPLPVEHIGIVGGVAGGAGLNLWFGDNWGVRPEVRYYLMASDLSGVRYTAGILHKF